MIRLLILILTTKMRKPNARIRLLLDSSLMYARDVGVVWEMDWGGGGRPIREEIGYLHIHCAHFPLRLRILA